MKRISEKSLPKPEVPKKAPAPEPAEEKLPASMRASMDFYEAQAEATRLIVARNNEVIAQFGRDLKEFAGREPTQVPMAPAEPIEYTFDIERDDDKLLKRIFARPGIIN